jgi:Transposase IS4
MQRPRRSAKPVTFYDDKLAQEEEVIKKARLETSKKRRAHPLQPVAVEKLPQPLQTAQQDPLPEFTPPFRIAYQSFCLRYTPYSPLSQFLYFFPMHCVDCIVENTNSYASHWRPQPLQKYTRKWHDVTRQEILRYIGLLFYMGRHIEHDRESYWKNSALGQQPWSDNGSGKVLSNIPVSLYSVPVLESLYQATGPMVVEARAYCLVYSITLSASCLSIKPCYYR